MSQLTRIGNFLVEIDGTKLTFFDALGNPIGQPLNPEPASMIVLPDGQEISYSDIAEWLASDDLAAFETAAGDTETPAGAETIESGGGRFAAFDAAAGIGGFSAVGGLSQSSTGADYSLLDFPVEDDIPLAPASTLDLPRNPIAEDGNMAIAEDHGLEGRVNGFDPDGNSVSYILVTPPAHGSLTFNDDGSFTYIPNPDFNGTDGFTYKVNDGSADSNVAMVGITVNPVNDLPIAADGSLTLAEDHSVSSAVAAGDVDGDALTYALVDAPQHGTLAFNADGTFTYTPDPDFNGADSFTYKADDGSGTSNVASVALNVTPVNDAPVIASEGSTTEISVTRVTVDQNPFGDNKVGDYLAAGGTDSKSVNPAMINGVNSANLTLTQAADVKVSFVSEGAGYRSMVGTYTFDADGNIDPSSVKFIWLDTTQAKQNVAGGALQKDFLGNSQPQDVDLGNLSASSRIGFFIIADGASQSANVNAIKALAGVDAKGNDFAKDMAAINATLDFAKDANGNGQILLAGKPLAGHVYFTHDKSLNTDNNKNDIEHTLSGVTSKPDEKLYVGFEDLAGGGDKDYDDVIIKVDIGSYNINKLCQTTTQPVVILSDVDNTHLMSAVITTQGFVAGDMLNLPDNPLFSVSAEANGHDVIYTVTAKAGVEAVDVFEDFLNNAFFSTSTVTEGHRTITYQVTDADGLTSNPSTADVHVSSSYEISVSELNNLTALGSGDDTLHHNAGLGRLLDLGDGHDTVHLAQANAGFGASEAAMLRNVEAIDARGAGSNEVALSVIDVLDMTDGDNHLTILGEKGDSLTLTGTDGHQWNVVEQAADFTTYSYDDGTYQAVIEVANQMAQTVV